MGRGTDDGLRIGNLEHRTRPTSRRVSEPCATIQRRRDLADDRQAETRSRSLRCSVAEQPFVRLEEPRALVRRDARPFIVDIEADRTRRRPVGAKLDPWSAASVLESIVDEID